MGRDEADHQLLSSTDNDYTYDDLNSYDADEKKFAPQSSSRNTIRYLMAALSISSILNCALLVAYHLAKSQIHLCPSEYTGLGLTTKATYWQSTDYTDENRTISDAVWEAIDTSPNTVSLDKGYTQKHGIADSIPFPWDQSKGLYIIKAFHHMHCLKNIRHAYNEALESHPGQHQLIAPEHIYHCLDILRQDIMCRPDDTPMPTTQERHKIGDGQERRCKDWNALIAWTQQPKREACFRMFSDYRRMHTLEQFAFCNEESEHKSVMEKYFREHGHKPMYLDEDKDLQSEDGY